MRVTASFIGLLLLLAPFVLASTATAPASAQEMGVERPARPSDPAPTRNDNTLYRGIYAVTEDGTLIYGSDTVYRCEDLVRLGAPAKPGSKGPRINGTVLEPLTQEAVELCAEAGFPPADATINVPASSDASEAKRGATTLPVTRGILPVSFLTVATLVIVCVFLVLRTRHQPERYRQT